MNGGADVSFFGRPCRRRALPTCSRGVGPRRSRLGWGLLPYRWLDDSGMMGSLGLIQLICRDGLRHVFWRDAHESTCAKAAELPSSWLLLQHLTAVALSDFETGLVQLQTSKCLFAGGWGMLWPRQRLKGLQSTLQPRSSLATRKQPRKSMPAHAACRCRGAPYSGSP